MKSKGIKLAKKAFQSRPRRFSVVWMLPKQKKETKIKKSTNENFSSEKIHGL